MAIVDDEMFPVINQYRWYADKYHAVRNYRISESVRGRLHMHHLVAGFPIRGFVIDHINGNGLDNRRENLRVVSFRENMMNQKIHRNGKLIGASFQKARGSWRSVIKYKGRQKHLGEFSTEMAAHLRYLEEADILKGTEE